MKQLSSKREEAVAVEKELSARTKDVEDVKRALESVSFDEGEMEALQKVAFLLALISLHTELYIPQISSIQNFIILQDRMAELEIVQKLKDEIRMLTSRLGNVDFQYRDPARNFDRSKVKGVVAKLIKVKDSSAMTALEVRYALNFCNPSHMLTSFF